MLSLRPSFCVAFRQISTKSPILEASFQQRLEKLKTDPNFPERPLKRAQKGFTADGGEVYHGFTYYPRSPDQVDPPCTPSPVFMVQRIRSMKKKPYWDKNILKQLGLDGISSNYAILPNTPQINALLWNVKHLIRITPITFPDGIPEGNDLSGARLQDNGELVFVPQLKSDTKLAEMQAQKQPDPSHLDTETLKKHMRLQWTKPWK
nr:EOG090X0EYV [Sida crystallina]